MTDNWCYCSHYLAYLLSAVQLSKWALNHPRALYSVPKATSAQRRVGDNLATLSSQEVSKYSVLIILNCKPRLGVALVV